MPVISLELVDTTDISIARHVRVKSVPHADIPSTLATLKRQLHQIHFSQEKNAWANCPTPLGMYLNVPIARDDIRFLISSVNTNTTYDETENPLCARRVDDSTQAVLDDRKSAKKTSSTSIKTGNFTIYFVSV